MYNKFAAIYDYFMIDIDYQAWAEYIKSIFEKLGLEGAINILDCACGTGNLTIPLAKLGNKLIGADLSEEMLSIAAQKSREKGLRLPYALMDMRSLELHKKSDAINCACDGVNYLLDESDLRAFFQSAYSCLKKGGVLAFDISSAYKLENILSNNIFGEESQEAAYIWRNNYDIEQSLLEMELIFFLKEGELYQKYKETHIQKAHSHKHILNILKEAGFSQAHAWDFMTFNPVELKSERIQFAAIK